MGQAMAPAAEPTTVRSSSGRGLLIGGIATLVAGLVLVLLAAVGGVRAGLAIVDLLGTEAISAPTEVVTDFEAGSYSVYQKADGTAVALSPQTVSVTGAQGPVMVRDAGTTETLTRGQVVYEAVARFTIAEPGRYTVSLRSTDPTEVVIGPSLAVVLSGALPWVMVLGLGILVSLVGAALLIATIVRRRRTPPSPGTPMAPGTPPAPEVGTAQQTPPASALAPVQQLPPAGWYPDPAATGGQRYWDGRNWTEHTA
ncbi:MAG: DUF2510 domain-containing protein [Candidatus Nanopelagicales bacterium]